MTTIDDLKRLAGLATENPYPHDGLRQFMEQNKVNDPYYAFLYNLAAFMQCDAILDIGGELGRSAFALAVGCRSADVTMLELLGKIPSTWAQFLGQCDNVRIVCGTNSVEWLTNPYNRRRKLSLVHIDSDHTFDGTLSEYCLVRPLMEPGGVIVFDDVEHDGPKRVLSEIALPKIVFDGSGGVPKLHGDNGYACVLCP